MGVARESGIPFMSFRFEDLMKSKRNLVANYWAFPLLDLSNKLISWTASDRSKDYRISETFQTQDLVSTGLKNQALETKM